MKDLKLFFIGLLIGIGKIIPGVSGAMFAMIFGVYEKSLNIISNLKTELKKNIKFISLLGVGVVISIFFGSNIIKYFLNKYYLSTMMFFIGMMVAGIKPLFYQIKNSTFKLDNLLIAIIVVLILLILSVGENNVSNVLIKTPFMLIIFFITGFLDAMGTVIPGVSGTALLMIIGDYDIVLNSLSTAFNISKLSDNLFVLVPFIIGLASGIIIIAKIVNYLFNNHRLKTYYSIIGFAITSVIILFLKVIEFKYSFLEIIIAIIMFIIGYIISYIFEKIEV